MSAIATSVLAGASLGLSIAAPIGPTSLLCVQRTLSGGLPIGLATGLGVATVHLTYGILAACWGVGFAAAWSNVAVLSLVSGIVLLAFSIRVLRSVLVMSEGNETRRNLGGTYCSAIGFALMNPITPVLFLAATPTLLGPASAQFPSLVTGVFLGSLGWWVTLNTAVSVFRGCVTSRLLNRVNRVAGLVLAALAVGLLARGLAESLDGTANCRIDGGIAWPAALCRIAESQAPGPSRRLPASDAFGNQGRGQP